MNATQNWKTNRREFIRRSSGIFVPAMFGILVPSVSAQMRKKKIVTAVGGTLSVVQAKKGESSFQTSTATFGAASTAANLLVAAVFSYGGSSTHANHAVTDDHSSTWVKITGVDNTNIPEGHVSMWYLKNCAAGISAIQGDGGANGTYCIIIVHEVSGASTTAPFTSGESSALATPSATANPQTTAVTIATANSILFAALAENNLNNPETMTVNSTGSSGGTWALKSSTESQEQNGSAFYPLSVPFVITTGTGSFKHGWTLGGSTHSAMVQAAFH
jgi:hypothetical protein